MSQNPYAPPSASFEAGSPDGTRTDFGFRLGASLFWRVLLLQFLVTIPVLSFIGWPNDFIAFKPSVVCCCAAIVLALSVKFAKPGALFFIWGRRLNLGVAAWRRFNWMAAAYYFALATGNFVLALSVPIETWLTVKMFFPLLSLIAFCAMAPRFLRGVGK